MGKNVQGCWCETLRVQNFPVGPLNPVQVFFVCFVIFCKVFTQKCFETKWVRGCRACRWWSRAPDPAALPGCPENPSRLGRDRLCRQTGFHNDTRSHGPVRRSFGSPPHPSFPARPGNSRMPGCPDHVPAGRFSGHCPAAGPRRGEAHLLWEHRMPEKLLEGLEGISGVLKGQEKITINFECEIHMSI